MKAKSKSTISLPRSKDAQIQIRMSDFEQLQHKQATLEILQDKVARSKPILQTIYEKVKRKERLYTQEIGDLKQVAKDSRVMASQYKELYEEGLRIMQRNQLVDQFAGKSNYRRPNTKQSTHSEQSLNNIDRIKREYSKENKPSKPKGKIDEIIEEYKHKKGVYPITKEEIYRRYMEKLGEDAKLTRKETNNLSSAKQLSHKLLRQFDSDLNRLERSRDKSRTEYKPLRTIDEYKMKDRYLKLQQEKLLRI